MLLEDPLDRVAARALDMNEYCAIFMGDKQGGISCRPGPWGLTGAAASLAASQDVSGDGQGPDASSVGIAAGKDALFFALGVAGSVAINDVALGKDLGLPTDDRGVDLEMIAGQKRREKPGRDLQERCADDAASLIEIAPGRQAAAFEVDARGGVVPTEVASVLRRPQGIAVTGVHLQPYDLNPCHGHA